MMSSLNKSLMFMLIFTIVSSLVTYVIVVKAYEGFEEQTYYGE